MARAGGIAPTGPLRRYCSLSTLCIIGNSGWYSRISLYLIWFWSILSLSIGDDMMD